MNIINTLVDEEVRKNSFALVTPELSPIKHTADFPFQFYSGSGFYNEDDLNKEWSQNISETKINDFKNFPVDYTFKHTQNNLKTLFKYNERKSVQTISFSFWSAILFTSILFVVNIKEVKKHLVDNTYLLIFVICILRNSLNSLFATSTQALIGVALSVIFPYINLLIAPYSKITVIAMIAFSTLFVNLFIQNLPDVRFWFTAQNIYYFYIFLTDQFDHYYPIRQVGEFAAATVFCFAAGFVPIPLTTFKEFRYRIRLAFEKAVNIFCLLIKIFVSPSSGNSFVLLTKLRDQIEILIEARDYIHKNFSLFAIESVFHMNLYLETKILLKLLGNIVVCLKCAEIAATRYVEIRSENLPPDFAKCLLDLGDNLSLYVGKLVEKFVQQKIIKTDKLNNSIRTNINDAFSFLRAKRYTDIYTDTLDPKSKFDSYVILDFLIFCILKLVYFFTLIEEIIFRRRFQKSNFYYIKYVLKEIKRTLIDELGLYNYFTSFETYARLMRDNIFVLLCIASIIFLESKNTMDFIFPIVFCWAGTFGVTFSKNLQRMMGTFSGCLYGLILITFFNFNLYIISIAMFFLILFNTYISGFESYAPYAEISSFSACWTILVPHLDNITFKNAVLNRVSYTYIAAITSIIGVVFTLPTPALKKIKKEIKNNLLLIVERILGKNDVFGIIKLTPVEKRNIENGIYDKVCNSLLNESDEIEWKPLGLKDFTNDENLEKLNNLIYKIEITNKKIETLFIETNKEISFFFKKPKSKKVLAIKAQSDRLINFCILMLHSISSNDIRSMLQCEGLLLNYNKILKKLTKFILKISGNLNFKNNDLEIESRKIISKINKMVKKIDKRYMLYLESVSDIVQKRKKQKMFDIDESYSQYRHIWGLNAFIFCLKQSLLITVELVQSVFSLKEFKLQNKPPSFKWKCH